jgi:hypothetical protein
MVWFRPVRSPASPPARRAYPVLLKNAADATQLEGIV